jgi:serine/threonine protein kinase
MAEVWRGKMFGAGGSERLVAIKRVLPSIAEDNEFISMFIDEARISAQLAHVNIARIYEWGHISNSYFIAMEYIPGRDMRAIFDQCRRKGEPAPIPLVAHVVSRMCAGLDYAHHKKGNQGQDLNIVHRDISPQNVLISFEGEVKVIDFGIAKAAGKVTKTQAGILKGKFGYMSPEQARGLELDRRSDVFAIGVCLYEMLTGERLFVGDSDFIVLEKVRRAEVAPPSTYNKRIPEALEKIVLKALARDVGERYQYANELGDDLQRFLLASDTLFGREDLRRYMKATFAEDVESEQQRLREYADIKAPESVLSAIGGASRARETSGAPATPPLRAPSSRMQPVVPASRPPAEPAPRAPNHLPLILSLVALMMVLMGAAVVFLKMRPEPTGFLLVRLSPQVHGSVRVSVSGQELPVSKSGPMLRKVPAGPAVVLVSAEGYKPFTQSVVVQPGTTLTLLEVKLEREVRASAPDGKSMGVRLEPEGFEVEVRSVPTGATIFAGGKEWGVTPARVRLPADVKQMSLKLRCHDEVEVDVAPAAGGGTTSVKKRLKKQRGCRY